jgi:glycosyltransferase involved in cell wall biosynthesis
VNEEKNPENTEHFGITTLEAMATGAIPFVVAKGGQKEIVSDERLFWETEDELAKKTASFIQSMKADPKSWQNYSIMMIRKAEHYTKANFETKMGDLI